MKLGISSYTYGWAVAGELTAIQLIDRAAGFGVGVLQLADNLPPPGEAELRHARAAGITLEIGTRGCQADHLRRFIDIAQQAASPILRVVLDTADDHPSPDEVVRRLSGIDTHGVIIAIENHDRFKSATLVDIVRRCRNVGICLDTANSLGVPEGPEHVVDTLGPHVVNLHVKDFAVQRVPYLQGFTVEGRPAGQGMLDVPWLLQRLQHFGRDCSAIAELWVPPESSMDATIEKEARWAEQSVAYLKPLIA